MTINFPESLAAHKQGRAAKFALCKALAREIPVGPTGVHTGRDDSLRECAEELGRESGEPISWETLKTYRLVGLWLGDNEPVSGETYSSHRDGMTSGKSFDEWKSNPAATSRSRSVAVDSVSHASRVDVARELMINHPEAVREAIEEAGSTTVARVIGNRDVEYDRDVAFVETRDPDAAAARLGSGVSRSPQIESRGVAGTTRLTTTPTPASENDVRANRLAAEARQRLVTLSEFVETHALSDTTIQKITLELMEARDALDAVANLLTNGVIANS